MATTQRLGTRTRMGIAALTVVLGLVVVLAAVVAADATFDPVTRAMVLMTWGTLTGTGSLGGQ